MDVLSGYTGANVTGARGSQAAATRLVGDALALVDVDEARERAPGRWLDLGTGNGVPGIPLLLALPGVEMTLVDSVRRKCEFVTGVVDELGLAARARVACARSERLGAVGTADRESYDAVVAKAVGPLATLVELAAPLLAAGGVLLAYKGERAAGAEWAAAEAAGALCGLGGRRIAPLPRSPLAHSVCAVFEKVAPCPETVPRREGLARAKPLGG